MSKREGDLANVRSRFPGQDHDELHDIVKHTVMDDTALEVKPNVTPDQGVLLPKELRPERPTQT